MTRLDGGEPRLYSLARERELRAAVVCRRGLQVSEQRTSAGAQPAPQVDLPGDQDVGVETGRLRSDDTVTGTATDLDIRAKETIRLREELNELYAKHTGQDVEKIANDTDRDFFMSAQEAKEYGLLDDVIMTTAPAPNGQVKK